MLDNLDLKLGVELLGVLVALIALILKLHQKNTERLHELSMKSISNGEQLNTIRGQLDHQDKCIDEMKRDMISFARGNPDIVREVELNRVRQAISMEITRTADELRERIRVLEARAMRDG